VAIRKIKFSQPGACFPVGKLLCFPRGIRGKDREGIEMMRRLWGIVKFLLAALLIAGTVQIFFLAFYLATNDSHVPPGTKTYSLYDAFKLVAVKGYSFLFAPVGISLVERTVLEQYGNALILFISVAAVIFSSIAVVSKLAEVGDLITYEKFGLWYGFLFRRVPFVRHRPKWNLWFESFQQDAYKNLAVKKMVHSYQNADHLIIMSGNYSWLFDTQWSEQALSLVQSKLPNEVCLLSWSTPQEVADHWKANTTLVDKKKIFEAIRFVHLQQPYNGSVVKTGSKAFYIYLYRETNKSELTSSVCLFHGVREAETLVQIVEDELRRLHGEAATDVSLNAEKTRILDSKDYFSNA
jgi:hypothetical protein